jgi:hypothetical protein
MFSDIASGPYSRLSRTVGHVRRHHILYAAPVLMIFAFWMGGLPALAGVTATLPVVLMLDELPVLLVRMLREANMFDFGPPSLWAPALSLLECQDEDHLHCTLRLCLLGAVRGPRALLDRLRADLDGEPMKYDNTTLQRLTMQMAAAGGLREAIELCSLPAVALAMEPMVVALRLRLGETVDAPVEMLEIAPDVNARVDALIATGDTWRKDPLALILPDEVGQSDEGIHVEPHGIAGAH